MGLQQPADACQLGPARVPQLAPKRNVALAPKLALDWLVTAPTRLLRTGYAHFLPGSAVPFCWRRGLKTDPRLCTKFLAHFLVRRMCLDELGISPLEMRVAVSATRAPILNLPAVLPAVR
jgi:hypothetical protein